jgi:hypothetical protein
MRFHFLLTNHYPYGCYRIEDIVVPIAAGLGELGHAVTYGFDDDVAPWPAVNLLVEFFNDPKVVDQVAALKSSGKPRICFGLIGIEDIQDRSVMAAPNFPDRRPNLERLLKLVDFGWTVVPCDYGAMTDPTRVRFLEYGYAPSLRRDGAVPRDVDVLFYGSIGGRRTELFNALVGRGLSVEATLGHLPDYLRDDMLDRARLVADTRRDEAVRFLAPTRIVAALHSGVAVVSEQFDISPLSSLYTYVVTTTGAEFLDVCAGLARSDRFREAGQAARDAFARETSMARNVRRAMDIPVFKELTAG